MSGFAARTWKVELYGGDWQQRIEDAARAVDVARATKGLPLSLGETPDLPRLIAEYDALVAEAIDARVVVTLQALGRRKWAELVAANPPRTGDEVPEEVRKGDAQLGVNDQALADALLPLSIVKVEPDIPVDDLLDTISSAQFDLLYGRAFSLNRGAGADPKAAPRLTPSPSSGETES